MHILCPILFCTSLLLGIVLETQSTKENLILSHLALENAYLETAAILSGSPVWSHPPTPFDLLVAVALNTPKNITGQEVSGSRIISAFALALEMGHPEVIQKLLQVYEGQVWPMNTIMNALLRPSRKYNHHLIFRELARVGIFRSNQAELEKLLLQAVKDLDDSKYPAVQDVVQNLLETITSTGVLREGLFMAASLGHDAVGIRLFNACHRRLAQLDINMAYQIARNRNEKGRLAIFIGFNGGREYKDELPAVERVEGHFPILESSADSSENQLISILYHAGFGRLVVKLTENNPSLLHAVIGNNGAGSIQYPLHHALQLIAMRLYDDNDQAISNLAPFMVACIEGFDDVVDEYVRNGRIIEYGHLPSFKNVCLSKAVSNKHKNVIISLARAFSYEPATLSSVLMSAVMYGGNLEIVKSLVDAGADPVGINNEPLIEACKLRHTDIVWYLFGLLKVKEHESTPERLALYLFTARDIEGMRRLFLGDSPEITFNPLWLKTAFINGCYAGVEDFFADPDLPILLSRYYDERAVINVFMEAARGGQLKIVRWFLENLDRFGHTFIQKSLKFPIILAAAKGRDRDTVWALLHNPRRRSRRDRYRMEIRLLQRRASDMYVTEDFLKFIRASVLLHTHVKYYLPSETLHRIFPGADQWESDPFLREVSRSVQTSSEYTSGNESKERVFLLTFFDKSAGLFGDVNIEGGESWTNKYFIEMVQDMEKTRPLPPSRQMNTLKAHLRQVAEIASSLEGRPHDMLRALPVGETYLFSIESLNHTGYALATKTDDAHLNLKVFNSYHKIVARDSSGKIIPYVEWDCLPLEEVLSAGFTYFADNEFLFSRASKPHEPLNLPGHMKTKGQRIGSCSAFKFWLIARHDLETLPRFLEFSVAFHLAFIEDLTENFEERMQEWNVMVPRGWFAITRTPHFEGQLLKDIEAIKDIKGEEEMFQNLHDQIIRSVQRRYRRHYPLLCNWDDERAVREFIPWKEKFLAEIPDNVDDKGKELHEMGWD